MTTRMVDVHKRRRFIDYFALLQSITIFHKKYVYFSAKPVVDPFIYVTQPYRLSKHLKDMYNSSFDIESF